MMSSSSLSKLIALLAVATTLAASIGILLGQGNNTSNRKQPGILSLMLRRSSPDVQSETPSSIGERNENGRRDYSMYGYPNLPAFGGSNEANLPLPLRVMEQYKRWHSEDSLRNDPRNRTFALACKCPLNKY